MEWSTSIKVALKLFTCQQQDYYCQQHFSSKIMKIMLYITDTIYSSDINGNVIEGN